MADASRHKLYFIEETEYGVTPDDPVFVAIRHNGTTLGMAKSSQLSEELRADRQIADFRHGTRQVGGNIDFELSYGGSVDALLEAVLCGTWASLPGSEAIAAVGTLTLDTQPTAADEMEVGDDTYVFVASGDFDTALEIPIGASLEVTQASVLAAIRGTDGINAAHDEVTIGEFNGSDEAILTAITAGTAGNSIATVIDATGGNAFGAATLEDGAAAGANVDTLKAGTDRRSFTVLRIFDDMANDAKKYHIYTGCEFNTLALTVPPDGIVTVGLSLIGQDAGISDDAPSGATYGDPTVTRVFNGFGGSVEENGTAIAVATEIQINLENGIEPRFVIGSDTSIRPSIQRSNLSGTLGSWFEDATLIGKFFEETNSSIGFTLTDPEGNSYQFTIPNISFTGGQPDTSGQASIALSLPYQAVYDATVASNIRIRKIPT